MNLSKANKCNPIDKIFFVIDFGGFVNFPDI